MVLWLAVIYLTAPLLTEAVQNSSINTLNTSEKIPIKSVTTTPAKVGNFKAKDISFKLWTRINKNQPENYFYVQQHPYKFRYFNPHRETIVLIHGFANILKFNVQDFFEALAYVFLNKKDFNVIGVDWSNLTTLPQYEEAVENSEFIGNQTAALIEYLRKISKYKINTFHVVGFELGALIATVSGMVIKKKKIEKITALDPTNSGIGHLPKWRRLSKDAADLVEVIHTSGGFTGDIEPLGHRDFYPNGGNWPQPNCWDDETGECSKSMAWEFYGYSIAYSYFKATFCPSFKEFLKKLCKNNPTVLLYNEVPKKGLPEGKYFLDTSTWH